MPFVCVKPWDPKKKQKKKRPHWIHVHKTTPTTQYGTPFPKQICTQINKQPPPHRPSEKHARPPDHYGGKTSPYVQH